MLGKSPSGALCANHMPTQLPCLREAGAYRKKEAVFPPAPRAHLGNGNVIAAAARAQLPGAGVNWAVGGSEAARAGGPCGLHTL